jgi:hypothetical protein
MSTTVGEAKPFMASQNESQEVIDATGRKLTVTNLNASAILNVLEIAGASAGENQAWLRTAFLFCSVTAINGIPVPFPTKKLQLLRLADQVGNAGLIAVQAALYGPIKAEDDSAEEDQPAPSAAEVESATARSS